MTIIRIMVLGVLTGFALSACAPQPMYVWGSYEGGLYSYYENPENIEVLMKALDTTIVSGEESKRVPPGIYAEYGYILLIRNEDDEAISYFKREKSAWPESAVLMDKMITLTQTKKGRAKISKESDSAGEKE